MCRRKPLTYVFRLRLRIPESLIYEVKARKAFLIRSKKKYVPDQFRMRPGKTRNDLIPETIHAGGATGGESGAVCGEGKNAAEPTASVTIRIQETRLMCGDPSRYGEPEEGDRDIRRRAVCSGPVFFLLFQSVPCLFVSVLTPSVKGRKPYMCSE